VTGSIELVLPYPPSVNHYYRIYRGRMVIGSAGKKFRRQVADEVGILGFPVVGGDIRMLVELRPPPGDVPRDLDNAGKALLDSLVKAGVMGDDYQVTDLHLWRGEPVAGGICNVTVESIG